MPDLLVGVDAILQTTSTRFDKVTVPGHSFEIFDELPGFQWDDMYWPSPRTRNENAILPVSFDPAAPSLPNAIIQSGIGSGADIQLKSILDLSPTYARWSPQVKTGTYFVYRDRFYLYSEDSIITAVGEDLDVDGRSQLDLWYRPKPGVPITAAYLTYDTRRDINYSTEFAKVENFTGIVANGVELDGTDDINNINTALNEFEILYRPNNRSLGEILSPTLNAANIGTITLADQPLSLYPLVLTRPDLFITELSYNQWVEKFQDSTLVVGDYFIGYQDSTAPPGIIQCQFAGSQPEYGNISYTFNYPATILFNRDIRVNRVAANIGEANGDASFRVFLDRFPVHDESSPLFLDVAAMTLTVAAIPWTRVLDFTASGPADLHYTLDAEYGIITFGDGINGDVPAGNSVLLATYTYTPFVEYEPEGAQDCFVDETVNLDPTGNSLARGFIYLSNRDLIRDHIHLTTNHDINQVVGGVNHYGPIAGGAEIILMTGSLHDITHEPITNQEMIFVASPADAGVFIVGQGRTGPLGEVHAQFLAEGFIDALTHRVQFYEPEPDDPLFPAGTPSNFLTPTTGPPVGTGIVLSVNPGAGFAWTGTGAAWTNNTIVVPEGMHGAVADMIIFALKNNDVLNPYDNNLRTGGRAVILCYENTAGSWSILRPLTTVQAGGTTQLVFGRELTTKDATVAPHAMVTTIPTQVINAAGWDTMQYLAVGDKTISFEARTADAPLIVSNSLTFDVQADAALIGEWTLPTPTDDSGSGLSSATWMFLNSEMTVTNAVHQVTGVAQGALAGGYVVRIFGTKMPIDAELKPNVYVNGVLVPRANTALSATATYIDITSMPAGAALGVVDILVGYRRVSVDEPVTFTTFEYI